MNRLLVLTLVVLGSIPNFASAVGIKNVRPCWGPFGATRFEKTCLPGDIIFITYEIDDLAIDKDTKKARYSTTLELFDGPKDAIKGKEPIFKNVSDSEVIPALGGGRMSGDLHVTMPATQKAGKYTIKLTIHDKVAEKAVAFLYEFEVLPVGFGFIQVLAPCVGFPGQHTAPVFSLVNFGLVPTNVLDEKGKPLLDKDGKKVQVLTPNAELTIRILDENNKEVAEKAVMKFPDSLPKGTDLAKANIVQLSYPVLLNRTGRFTIEIIATDHNAKGGKRVEKLIYPLTVLDVGNFAAGK